MSLTGELEDFVNNKVSDGSYENAREVVRDALRHLQLERESSSTEAKRRVIVAQAKELADLFSLASKQFDEMNELSELTSMRLQMAMDRTSKLIETLSNVLKSMSTTQNDIVQNLK